MSYTVIITEEIAANVAVTTQNYPITIEYNATNIGAGTTYGNSNVSSLLASFGSNSISTTGNVTAAYFVGDGSQLTGLPGGLYGNADVSAYLASGTNTANIVTAGNVQGAFVKGNGSALSAITGANVTGTVANSAYATAAGTASTAGTANVALVANSVAGANVTGAVAQATQAATANVALVANSVAGANVSGAVAQATQAATANVANSVAGANVSGTVASATTATTAGTVTNAVQGNITSVGTLTGLSVSGNVTAGNVNITADAVITGNLTVNGTTTTINSNVVTVNDKTFVLANNQSTGAGVDGSGIIAGNPAVASLLYDNASGTWKTNIGVGVTGDVSASGNVIATGFSGSGAALSSITGANVTGNVSTALFAINAGTASTANTAGTATFADTANAVAGANVSGTVASATVAATVSGAAQANITSLGTLTSLSASGNITSSGNISGAFILGNGSQLTGLPATYGNANVVTLLAGFGSNTISTTGNVTAGNIVISQANNNIRNVNAWSANSTPQQARITMGTGYDGNFGSNIDPVATNRGAQLAVINKQSLGNADTNQSVRSIVGSFYADLGGGTLTNSNRRLQALQGQLHLGNGTIGFTTGPVYAAAAATGGTLNTGNVTIGATTLDMGAVTISHGAASLNSILVGGNSTIGNAVGTVNQLQFLQTSANVTSALGTLNYFTGTSATVPTNVYGYYMPGTTATHGVSNSNSWRAAANYYFLRNDDAVAQNQLGSLRAYHEFNGVSGTTAGSLTIDKNAGQVQQVNLTGNVSSVAFSNFVTNASDGTNTDEQCDTVTVVFNQGATGNFGVTFPTGSTFKYAGGITALQSVAANSVSLVSVSAVRLSGTTTYLISISPGFV